MAAKKHHLKKRDAPDRIDGDFIVVGCDLSLNRPGFCAIRYHCDTKTVSHCSTISVDNKSSPHSSDPRGCKLALIDAHYCAFITLVTEKLDSSSDLPTVIVRENSFSRFAAETQAISAVNGILDLETWNLSDANKNFVTREPQLIAPTTVKKLVSGCARASKDDIAEAVDLYCPSHPAFQCDDESDAMAVAIAWLINNAYLDAIPLDKYKEA